VETLLNIGSKILFGPVDIHIFNGSWKDID
jgi:hypothetical protein